MTAIVGQPIDAGAGKEVSAKLLCQEIQLVGVVFAVNQYECNAPACPSRSIDCLRLASQRMLSSFSIGLRSG
ncbi:hypothetical protein [Bradyrhizobium sp. CCBAU 11361]|uniref:hypothetical protein n=1 Tax=Bradyrhizobium sp. CCBAU 11361 TaxID=1630812 RepID=UPI0023033C93|nr:hypothetical protein [Bradyrhizobium sp. CCBAU 11361]MDA9488661.1 hypothetical protein [Bradyrhizobium sp. CCBAU 11361]